jgi:hypothetical protein
MTQVMQAQHALSAAAIRSEIIAADGRHSGNGCSYALAYSCGQEQSVKAVLRSAGIRVRSFYGVKE